MMYIRHVKYPVHALLEVGDNRLSDSLSVVENHVLLRNGIYCVNDLWIIRTTQRFDHLKPLSIFRLFTHLWRNKLQVKNQKNEVFGRTEWQGKIFLHT